MQAALTPKPTKKMAGKRLRFLGLDSLEARRVDPQILDSETHMAWIREPEVDPFFVIRPESGFWWLRFLLGSDSLGSGLALVFSLFCSFCCLAGEGGVQALMAYPPSSALSVSYRQDLPL